MDFLDKLRKQPENVRKIILWVTVIIVGLILLTLWIINISQKIKKIEKEKVMEELNLPALKGSLQELPQIELPEEAQEEFKKLDESIKALEKLEKEAGENEEKIELP